MRWLLALQEPAQQEARGFFTSKAYGIIVTVNGARVLSSLYHLKVYATVRTIGATAQSALGWYRPSVGVPETLDGRPSGVLV